MDSTHPLELPAKFNPTWIAIMKMRMSHVLLGYFFVGALAVALQAGRPPQGGDTKPSATAPQAAPAAPAGKQAATAEAAPAPKPPAAPQPTTINLSPTGANLLQLGIQVNGPASYPFVFTAD